LTQEQRSRATREAILNATIQCLVERGYAGTSTTTIQQAAGVSRGALTHQFSSKQALMAAAVKHLTHARIKVLEDVAATRPEDADPIEWVIHLIWREVIEGHLFHAVTEVWTAARTDEALRVALRESERELDAVVRHEVRRTFGDDISSKPGFDKAIDAVIVYARGAATTNIMQRGRHLLASYERESLHLFRYLLEHPSGR